MLTGPLLIVTFVISIVFLLVTIIKFNMNAFVSLLLTSVFDSTFGTNAGRRYQ